VTFKQLEKVLNKKGTSSPNILQDFGCTRQEISLC